MWLFVTDKVTATVINLVIFGVAYTAFDSCLCVAYSKGLQNIWKGTAYRQRRSAFMYVCVHVQDFKVSGGKKKV